MSEAAPSPRRSGQFRLPITSPNKAASNNGAGHMHMCAPSFPPHMGLSGYPLPQASNDEARGADKYEAHPAHGAKPPCGAHTPTVAAGACRTNAHGLHVRRTRMSNLKWGSIIIYTLPCERLSHVPLYIATTAQSSHVNVKTRFPE